MHEYGWKTDEHDKNYRMQDMGDMSRSNMWMNDGTMQDNGWIMGN